MNPAGRIVNPVLVQGAAALLSGRGPGLKNMLAMGALGLLIFAGLGWYLDWYRVQKTAGPDGPSYRVDINKTEIRNDLKQARDKVSGFFTKGTPTSNPGAPPAQYPPNAYQPSPYPQQSPYPPQVQYPPATYPPQYPAPAPANPYAPQYPPGYVPPAPPPPVPQRPF